MLNTRNDRFRISARPATFVESTEVIIEDLAGQSFLLDQEREDLCSLSPADLAALGTYFEAALDCTWHTLDDLRSINRDTVAPKSLKIEVLVTSTYSPSSNCRH